MRRHGGRDILHSERCEEDGGYNRSHKGELDGKETGPHPSTTATVPVSSGALAVAAQVSQR
jgi:hypothetical protein